jgi:hypothetical protein
VVGTVDGMYDEALALKRRFFPDDNDNIEFRHLPEAKHSFLTWQAGVIEPETVQYNGSTLEVERFHLMFYASTKDALIALLDGPDDEEPASKSTKDTR